MGRARLPNYAIEGIEEALSLVIGVSRTAGEMSERLALLDRALGSPALNVALVEREVLRSLLAGRLLQAEVAELRALLGRGGDGQGLGDGGGKGTEDYEGGKGRRGRGGGGGGAAAGGCGGTGGGGRGG